jgi:hypothetical protein
MCGQGRGVALSPDQKVGPTKSGPDRPTLPRFLYTGGRTFGQLTNLLVANRFGLPYIQLHELRTRQADRFFGGD